MAVTNAEIQSWLSRNQSASDVDIARAMQQYGVSPAQMAAATGLSNREVDSRYQAANTTIQNQQLQQQMQEQLANLQKTILADPFKYNQKNPYLDQMSNSVTNQVTENLNRNILPGLTSAAVATGGMGGSRQGVLEANALKDANQGLSNSLTSMRYGDYNNAMQRQLSKYGMDQGFYTAQRGQDLQQTALGANLFNQGVTGMMGQGQGIYNLGLTQQQAPWQTLTGFNNSASPYTGFGSTTGAQSGNMLGGAMGGALMGGQLYNAWKGNAGQTTSAGQNMSMAPSFNINSLLG